MDAGQLAALAIVLGLFALVGWICRPRRREHDPRVDAVKAQFVELTEASSPADAEQCAAWLREHGVVALANAELVPVPSDDHRLPGVRYRSFVVVLAAEVDRARTLLADRLPEGTALVETPTTDVPEDVEEELGPEDEDEGEEELEEPPRLEGFMDRAGRVVDGLFRWGILLVLTGLAVATLWSMFG
jgi:hypothetical protein